MFMRLSNMLGAKVTYVSQSWWTFDTQHKIALLNEFWTRPNSAFIHMTLSRGHISVHRNMSFIFPFLFCHSKRSSKAISKLWSYLLCFFPIQYLNRDEQNLMIWLNDTTFINVFFLKFKWQNQWKNQKRPLTRQTANGIPSDFTLAVTEKIKLM